MAISGVNGSTNSNTGLYTAGAAVAGGVAGATYGYFSKPFLKNGEFTDEFYAEFKKEKVEFFEQVFGKLKTKEILLNKQKIHSIDEYKNLKMKVVEDVFNNERFDSIKADVSLDIFGLKRNKIQSPIIKIIEDSKTSKEFLANYKKALDENLKNKTLNDIKQQKLQNRKKYMEKFWDANNNKFINCDSSGGLDIKFAAKKIQLKAAGLYGAIGAAVLGLGTYLCCAGKNSSQPEQQKVD